MTEGSLVALPMHGEVKLRQEGYRTRDGHILEWIGRLRPDLAATVRSRPEPFPRVTLARRKGWANPKWAWINPQPVTVPPIRNRRTWWVSSLKHEPAEESSFDGAIVWNPIAGGDLLGRRIHAKRLVFDLLDDWTVHVLFEPIRDQVEIAYARMFEIADAVTANSEGTVALAARFGREAELLPNGVDPEFFQSAGDLRKTGEGPIIGYAGKLSERLDLELMTRMAASRPDIRFDVAGPLTAASRQANRRILRALKAQPNIRLLGDVHYDDMPELIAGWDIGWVPHRTGKFEVGGDAIKIYEYRAAGLPTLTTPIIGAGRAPEGVSVVEDGEQTLAAINSIFSDGRPNRMPVAIPPSMTWREKTNHLLELLNL